MMKMPRYRYLMLLMVLMAMCGIHAQTNNRLVIPDVTVQLGQTQLPIHIENTDEIVAVQFDLTLPTGMTAEAVGTLSNRGDDHQVTVRSMGGQRWRVLLYSLQNRPLKGQSGVVMYVPVTIPSSYAEGSEHQLIVSDATLSNVQTENVLTSVDVGKVKISKLPDLKAKNITADKETLTPGENVVISWQIENIGELATSGGWSEQISLVSTDGFTSKLLATTYYESTLDAKGVVSRQVELTVPMLLGIEGKGRLQVRIVAGESTGESTSAQANNTQKGDVLLNVEKKLSFELQPSRVQENTGTRITAKLNRSGSWAEEQTYTLTATEDSRISVPTSVKMSAGQSGAVFYLRVNDNSVLDEDSIVTITAEGNGYDPVNARLTIVDNEYPNLTVQASKSMMTEGETFQLTITASRISDRPVTVTLTSENSKRFSFPSQAVIEAGKSSVTVEVTAIDDELPSLDLSNAFTVSAPNFNKGEVIVVLKDNDLPVLELQLTPTTVSESAGPIAVAGVLRRTTKTNNKITVKLTDDANGGLYFGNRTLELAKGVEEVHFNFGPVDNANVDGDRTYTITAAVWLSSCSCGASGESAGYVTAQLQVLDNDGPALNLKSSLSTVKEGGKTTLTVSRNTTDNAAPLTVTLNSDYEEGLTYDHTVTIPAGQQSTTVEVTSAGNSVQGDSHTVIFTVQAEGYAKGTCFVMVTDQTLPDARISSIAADATEAEVGTQVKLTIEIVNDGAAELPAEVPVKIYHKGESGAIATLYTPSALAIGESVQLSRTITLPTTVGNHSYYAVVNESNKVNELSFTNNTSADAVVKVIAPFSVTVSTDKKVYQQGERILITGQLTGNGTANAEVDLYVINEGARQVQKITTDAQGAFSYEWELYNLQSGHFVVGACYPNEGLKTELTSFDVYGLRRTEYSNITCDVINGDTHTGKLNVVNPGNLSLTGVNVELLSVPSNCEALLDIPSTIAGGQTVQLSYSLKGTSATTENKWDEIKARVNTNEGVSLDVTLYFYCRNAQGKLKASTKSIVTTMTKGKSREYSIQVTNIGRGNTGKISLALPEFIKCLAGNTLPSINQNDTLTIPLSFTPTDDLQLNVPVTGRLGINCENGEGVPINLTITPVSEETGILKVDVCDEYTYNTSEAPHVENAEVVLRNPVTGALVTQGRTGANGMFTVELPEGYYKLSVTANNHDSYTNNVLVDPGKETCKVINLSAQSITVDWKVEETEIEDEYEIVTTVKFETNVPAPFVELIVPEKLNVDSLGEGESLVYYAVLTNKGLITAEYSELTIPSHELLTFEPLSEYKNLTILPQQSIFIPIKVTVNKTNTTEQAPLRRARIGNFNCYVHTGVIWAWDCGLDRKWNQYGIPIRIYTCDYEGVVSSGGPGGGGPRIPIGPGSGPDNGPGSGPGTSYGWTWGDNYVQEGTDTGCEPCQNSFLYKMVKCVTGRIPIFRPFWTIIGYVTEPEESIAEAARDDAIDIAERIAKRTKPVWGFLRRLIGYREIWSDCVQPLIEPCTPGSFLSPRRANRDDEGSNGYPSYIQEYQNTLGMITSAFNAEVEKTIEFFGNDSWLYTDEEELDAFMQGFLSSDLDYLSATSLESIKPNGISNERLQLFVERWNNTIHNTNAENKIDLEKYHACGRTILEAMAYAEENGYTSLMDMYEDAENAVMDGLDENTKSVCASVTLQIKQTMTMTRQAFRGTLTVFNGNETTAMTDMKLTLTVSNRTTGQVATSHEFQINAESLDGFKGELDLTSGWTLGANSTGTATILFIPTKYAAPNEPVEWSFGGTLSYVDPFTGLEVTRELYPVTLTVKPSPELDLTYFMQRDVYGDDPLTLDVVEPMKPAEFALLINNKGNGDATNVRMVTQQPEIIENEKGLLIDFELISSQVNGKDAVLSFGKEIANDFGTIPAHSQMYAQWWLTSTLLGHFTDYKVEASHVTSYGNEDLSLLDQVTIHELIHSLDVTKDGNKLRGFMVNDIADADDLPDMLYLTNAETAPVSIAATTNVVKKSATEYWLTVTPSQEGWNYGNLYDPTHGLSEIKRIVRQSDNKEIPLQNFWQTDRTLRDGKDWLYEYRLHFADEFANGAETYVLTVEPTPDVLLKVASIEGVPAEGDIAIEAVDEITVNFNKQIEPATFTTDDLTLAVQGVKQDVSQIAISSEDNKKFGLNLSKLNEQLGNGYYTLTMQTADITDNEGYQGKDGKQVGWIYFKGGLVQLLTSAWPANSGTVSRKTEVEGVPMRRAGNDENSAQYGSTVILVATPENGYEFSNWTLNGEVVSTEQEFSTTALGDMNVVANFVKKSYHVEIVADSEGGSITGAGTGIYEFGTSLRLTAVPTEDYVLKGWLVNGEPVAVGTNNTLDIMIDAAQTVTAVFEREFYRQSMSLARGWNWVSSYLGESLDLETISTYANRIVGQFDELIRDPKYGMVVGLTQLNAGEAYKVEANRAFENTFRGHLYNVETTPLQVHKGWNWLAYPHHEQMPIRVITNAEEGDYMTSQTGFAEFAEGIWEGTLETIEPGAGYLYKSVTDKVLVFDFTAGTVGNRAQRISAFARESMDVDIHRYPNTMNITMQIQRNGSEVVSGNYNIYAMVGDELRGVSKQIGNNHYLTVYGDKSGEMSFIVESADTGETFETTQTLAFRDDVVGSRKSPYILQIGNTTGIESVASDARPMTVYSMEGILMSRDATKKALKQLPKGVYIVNGRKCFVK